MGVDGVAPMWPWEHLALGYILYSTSTRVRHHRSPGGREVFILAFATQLPDLIDKPLAWTFGVFPSGVSVAHSGLTGVILLLCVVVVARSLGVEQVPEAFGVGYFSHLLGDVLYPLLTEGELVLGFLLWPLVPATPVDSIGFLQAVQEFWAEFLVFLATPAGRFYLLFEGIFLTAALLLWLRDGRPGLDGEVLTPSPPSAD